MQNFTETEQVARSPAEAPGVEETEAARVSHAKLSRRLISAASTTGLGSVASMALSLFASIAIARNGGPAGYAIYVIANMLVFVPGVLCSFGIPLALSRHVASEEENGNHSALRRSMTTMMLLLAGSALLTSLVISLNLSYFERRLTVQLGETFALMLPLMIVCAVISD
ncbi:MAG: hypothetical protein LC731_07420, partial [Acidobacteria bacterium]|nr:hypothetical protein [Acidobacteriota bacterium]